MPRKSRELRLSQSTDLLASYEKEDLGEDYRGRFIRDMVSRLDRGKGLSTKQRSWLDSLIEEGIPLPKGDPVLVEKIREAAELDGMQHRQEVLRSFLGTISRGYTLSEKQNSFLEAMLQEAAEIRSHGKFQPASSERLGVAASLLSKKGDWYWAHRPGTGKAYRRVNAWLNWKWRDEAWCDIKEHTGKDPKQDRPIEPHIDEWACNKVLYAAKTGLAQLDNPRHPIGSLCYIKKNGVSNPGVVMSDPEIRDGNVKQDVLVFGELLTFAVGDIRKRR